MIPNRGRSEFAAAVSQKEDIFGGNNFFDFREAQKSRNFQLNFLLRASCCIPTTLGRANFAKYFGNVRKNQNSRALET